MTEIFRGLDKAGLMDEVYIANLSPIPGFRAHSFKGYFKDRDADYGMVRLFLDKENRARFVAVPQTAILWVKSALTGEIVYQKDNRAIVFGTAE